MKTTKSRDDMFKEQYDTMSSARLRAKRTKIICTVSNQTCNFDTLLSIYDAGMNIIRLNLAYANEKQIEDTLNLKRQIEKERKCFIPVMADLKGSQARVGNFGDHGATLRAGQIFRITLERHLIGDENIVSCDDEDFFIRAENGDSVMIDYGQNSFTIVGKTI
eukprot:TRINITY_DN2838_c0_g1_i13.p3 TRINITY_DN2838_c0_g1~~TRINITY_DN2838_c0_g1_i13.p3  ORF type:complete len:163 (-),score=30.23 TRINITY_DN2838_c0_g1_i13:1715-2203(-)